MDISLLSLNPYPSYLRDNEIVFQTELSAEYSIYFLSGDGYFENELFAEFIKIFGFRSSNNALSFVPPTRISDTIAYHLYQFFEDNRHIALYVCDQSDNRQSNRKRLFDIWYKKYATRDFVKWDFAFEDSLYLSFILRNDNPYLEQLRESLPKAAGPYK